jgi:hypothetical protein
MGFFDMFGGGKNPADAAMPFLNQIPGQTNQFYQPYFNAGTSALPGLQEQYGGLLNDPGAMMNKFGESYQSSPGLQFQIQQALGGAGNAAAAGGMAGSPQHEQQNMQLANNIASQDYNNWMKNAIGLYGQGLTGQQGLANMGQQAGQSNADMLAQTLAQQGNLAFNGAQQQNQNKSDMWNNVFKLGGAAVGGAVGGPWGAFAGYNAMK